MVLFQLLIFVVVCSSLLLVVKAIVICPPEEAISKYLCKEYKERPDTIELLLVTSLMGDAKASELFDLMLKTEDVVSPLGKLLVGRNTLTRIPEQIKRFPQLDFILLSDNNITSVESGAFNFTSQLRYLSLGDNHLTTIAPGAFQGNGYGDSTKVSLEQNNLTRFEATVFKSLLEKIEPFSSNESYRTMVNILRNPIECDCHLAWLIRDNHHLLKAVKGGRCSNGTYFEEGLKPEGFADCASFVCPLGYDGLYADPSNCSKYYNCIDHKAFSFDCPMSIIFNPITKQCDDKPKKCSQL